MKTELKAIVALLSLTVASSAFAGGFSGNWNGTGQVEIGTPAFKRSLQCDAVSFSIEQTADKLALNQCEFDKCADALSADNSIVCDVVEMSISDGKLFYEGNQVGFVTESAFLVNYHQDDWVISVSGLIKDGQFNYNYTSSNPPSQMYLKVKASLSR
jgi:hypothetical protein